MDIEGLQISFAVNCTFKLRTYEMIAKLHCYLYAETIACCLIAIIVYNVHLSNWRCRYLREYIFFPTYLQLYSQKCNATWRFRYLQVQIFSEREDCNLVPRLLPSHALKLRKDPGWGWSRDTPESGVFSISVLKTLREEWQGN